MLERLAALRYTLLVLCSIDYHLIAAGEVESPAFIPRQDETTDLLRTMQGVVWHWRSWFLIVHSITSNSFPNVHLLKPFPLISPVISFPCYIEHGELKDWLTHITGRYQAATRRGEASIEQGGASIGQGEASIG